MMIEGRAAPSGGGAEGAPQRCGAPKGGTNPAVVEHNAAQSNTLSQPACVGMSWPHGPELRPIPTQCARTGRPDRFLGRVDKFVSGKKDGGRACRGGLTMGRVAPHVQFRLNY
eukprot:scaffold103114_cov63-Phaeocystis_antarctica.AAC.3